MSPDQKAAGIHLAFVFMTIQGRGQQQVRPTEIHRDYFVDVGCLCSDGVFYNRLLKLCCNLFVLVSWQSRLEHGNCCGFPGFCFVCRKSIASWFYFIIFFSKDSKICKMWSICPEIQLRIRAGKHPLGCQSQLTHPCRQLSQTTVQGPCLTASTPSCCPTAASASCPALSFVRPWHPCASIKRYYKGHPCLSPTVVGWPWLPAGHAPRCSLTPIPQQGEEITWRNLMDQDKDSNWEMFTRKTWAGYWERVKWLWGIFLCCCDGMRAGVSLYAQIVPLSQRERQNGFLLPREKANPLLSVLW